MDKRRIVFVIFDGFQSLDLTGPHEVFKHASPLTAEHDCQIVSSTKGPVRSSSGLSAHASHGVHELDPGGIDTLVVAAGLVTGRRVTTHWSRARQLADEHPGLIVDCDPIFIQDGRVWTSAGVCAGMDLALALVEDDLGQPAAHAVAQELVLFLRRPGTQSQFSVPLWSAQPSTDPIKTVVAAVQAGPAAAHDQRPGPPRPAQPPSAAAQVYRGDRCRPRAVRGARARRGGPPCARRRERPGRRRGPPVRIRHRRIASPRLPSSSRRRAS